MYDNSNYSSYLSSSGVNDYVLFLQISNTPPKTHKQIKCDYISRSGRTQRFIELIWKKVMECKLKYLIGSHGQPIVTMKKEHSAMQHFVVNIICMLSLIIITIWYCLKGFFSPTTLLWSTLHVFLCDFQLNTL